MKERDRSGARSGVEPSLRRTKRTMVLLENISKRFGPVVALDSVDLDVAPGEIHAIAGENGAGKSTLARILDGLERPDTGRMHIDGERYRPRGPRDAELRGIGMVHQHFMLIPTMTALDNAILGDEPVHAAGMLDRKRSRQLFLDVAERYGLDLDPGRRVENMSVGERQRLEILKVLWRGARVLILDEPTTVLTPQESRALYETIHTLAQGGTSAILITHRLPEILEHADRVTILRRGKVVSTTSAGESSERELARQMVGREPAAIDPKPRLAPGDVALVLRDVREILPRREAPRLNGIFLQVREGEIVGIAGVEGNGQRELEMVITGMQPYRGEIRLRGTPIADLSPAKLRRLGLAHIPGDRREAGVIDGMTAAENLVLGKVRERRFRHGAALDRRAILGHARERIEAFAIVPENPSAPLRIFSGGNQQKIVLARETEGNPPVLLAVHPTRGVDIATQEAIHQRILDLRDHRGACLLISSDLSEVLRLADRIFVLVRGQWKGQFSRGGANEETLGLCMTGEG
jgi:simple sugar transport system ATP-binding protein